MWDKAHKVSALQLDLSGQFLGNSGTRRCRRHQLKQDVIGAVGVVASVADSTVSTSCRG